MHLIISSRYLQEQDLYKNRTNWHTRPCNGTKTAPLLCHLRLVHKVPVVSDPCYYKLRLVAVQVDCPGGGSWAMSHVGTHTQVSTCEYRASEYWDLFSRTIVLLKT